MGEVNLMKFVTEHIFLVAVAAVSGGMLVWPAIRRSTGGASISTLQATLLINQQNARDADVFVDALTFFGRRRLHGTTDGL